MAGAGVTGVAIAAVVIGSAWSAGRRLLAFNLVGCIVAGEAYGLITTAERLMAAREAAQAPLQAAAKIHAMASRRVADAAQGERGLADCRLARP